jgi:eukaryotic-like serine/threonine-protein kinase
MSSSVVHRAVSSGPESTLEVSGRALPPDADADRIEAEILAEMTAAWREGRRLPAEHWLSLHPQIAAVPEAAVRIIYEEVCLREAAAEKVGASEIVRRFPQWRSQLEVLLDCHRLMQPEASAPLFPEAGDRLGEFRLLAELGRGAVGRVFLATQPALSDRPVVVKLTPAGGDEHLSLARLQHTNIAPLYLVQDYPAENLRALCMPYVGGASWAAVLETLRKQPGHRLSGRQIVEALATAQGRTPLPLKFTGPALFFLNRATYVQAVCWIGAHLADALQYAHQRGLVHLDIKSSNVLIAGDGQPMLLDFHLAREVVPAGSGPLDRMGGTRGFMSPEQEAAATAVRDGRKLELGLDGRSDIYSLGLLLVESLGGSVRRDATGRPTLRKMDPDVSRGLADVLSKCLAQSPDARYRDAGELAADLRRHLADLPLRGVANRSWPERWQKWRRRRPHALWLSSLVLIAVGVVGSAALLAVGDRLRSAQAALDQGNQQLSRQAYTAAIEQLQAGASTVAWLPGQRDLKQALHGAILRAKHARLADSLHTLVERLRFAESFHEAPTASLREFEAGCRTIWQARAHLVETSAVTDEEIDRQARADLLELALLWVELRIRLAPPGEQAAVRSEALRLFDEAQATCGNSLVLELARREYAPTSPGSTHSATLASTTARTAWEHMALGRFLLRSNLPERAQEEFQRAVDLEPGDFWPNFYQAVCAYRRGEYAASLTAASVCVALSPKRAECFFNRALAEQALGNSERALRDLDLALKLDPTLAVVEFQRGKVLSDERRFADAKRDFESAMRHGAEPASVHYQLALVHLAEQDRQAARASLGQALQHNRHYEPALALQARLDTGR